MLFLPPAIYPSVVSGGRSFAPEDAGQQGARRRPGAILGIRNPIASIVKRAARMLSHPVIARRRGVRFLLDPRNWIDNRIYASAGYENRQVEAARAAIGARGIDLVIDIGANIGFYTVMLGVVSGVREVIAFEPVRRNYAQLWGNVFVNGLANKVEAHRLGLGAADGVVEIHIDPTSTGVSRVDLETTARSRTAFKERETVRIARFDDICALVGRNAFVKIDVEGAAAGVIAGMENFLKNNNALLQVELSDAEGRDVTALLLASGYAKVGQIDADALFAKGA